MKTALSKKIEAKDLIQAEIQHYYMLVALYRSEGDDANASLYDGIVDDLTQELVNL